MGQQNVGQTMDVSTREGLFGITRYQWLVFFVVWAGWALDATDFNLFSLVLKPAVTEVLGGSPSPADIGKWGGLLAMAGLLGWALGAGRHDLRRNRRHHWTGSHTHRQHHFGRRIHRRSGVIAEHPAVRYMPIPLWCWYRRRAHHWYSLARGGVRRQISPCQGIGLRDDRWRVRFAHRW